MDGNFHRSAFRWTLVVMGLFVAMAIFKTCSDNNAPKPYVKKAAEVTTVISLEELA